MLIYVYNEINFNLVCKTLQCIINHKKLLHRLVTQER